MNKVIQLVTTLAVLSLNTSCASFKKDDSIGGDGLPAYDTQLSKNDDLVASNLIYALAQLNEVRPSQTTIQINEPVTPLGKTIEARLRNAGYGIQKVESDLGRHYVRYKYEDSTTEKGAVSLYKLSVGPYSLERDFSRVGNDMLPDSALIITGAKETEIELNDDIFPGQGSSYEEAVFFEASEVPVLTEVATNDKNTFNTVPGVKAIKQNMYETMESNYKGLFAEYDDVDSQVLVFANDSMILGNKNKKIIQQYIQKMNPQTDLISVIGCSHGKSGIKNGNSVLALGRANRVKEAFVYAGVEYGKVLDEGCWANKHFDEMMPRRGVVLTLKRQKG